MNIKHIVFLMALLWGASSSFAQSTALSPTFTKITTGSLVTDLGMFTGCAWGDFDNDGHLDVIVANWANHTNLFYHNNGDSTNRTSVIQLPLSPGTPHTFYRAVQR